MRDFFKGKKIIITGNTGFKGSWLSQILLNFGADVVGISLPPETNPSLFKTLSLDTRMKTYFCDVRNFQELDEIFQNEKPEIVFHLAAQALVRDSYDDPLKTFSSNSLGTANVLEVIRKNDFIKSAVIITTDKVYFNNGSPVPYKEDDPLGGYDPYSASKAAADVISNSYINSFFNIADFGKKHNTLIAIARAGNVIGGGDWANDRLIPDIIRAIYDKKEEVVLRSPNAVRPWQHVLDPLNGYLALAEGLYNKNIDCVGAWNFGPEQSGQITVEHLVGKAIEILGMGSYRVEADNTKHEATLLSLNIDKSKKLLGWSPIIDFEKSIKMTFDWYRSFYEKKGDIVELTNQQIRECF